MATKSPKKKAPHLEPVPQTKARAYVNKLAPNHEKNSCSEVAEKDGAQVETISMNSRYASDDFGGCYRCTLMEVLNLAASGEMAPEKDEED